MSFLGDALELLACAAPLHAKSASRNARSEAKQEPGVGSVQDTHPLASPSVLLATELL